MEDKSEFRVFSLSMLDAILGGLGAMVIVVLLLSRLLDVSEARVDTLAAAVEELEADLAELALQRSQDEATIRQLRAEVSEVESERDRLRGNGRRNNHREWQSGRNIVLTDTNETSQGWRIRYQCSPSSGWLCYGCGGQPATSNGYSGR